MQIAKITDRREQLMADQASIDIEILAIQNLSENFIPENLPLDIQSRMTKLKFQKIQLENKLQNISYVNVLDKSFELQCIMSRIQFTQQFKDEIENRRQELTSENTRAN